MSMVEDNIVNSLINNVLYPQDSVLALATGIAATALSGFKWKLPNKIDIIKCEYSQFTVYNKQISNSVLIKQNTISISGTRQLDEINRFTTNIITNTLLIKLLRNYIKQGGLFMLVTGVGVIENLSVQDFNVSYDNTPQPWFNFTFIQQNIDEYLKTSSKSIRNTICI